MGHRIQRTATIGIAPKLMDKIDAEAQNLSLSRSAFITMCVNQYFKNEEALSLLAQARDLYVEAKAIADNAQLSLDEVVK